MRRLCDRRVTLLILIDRSLSPAVSSQNLTKIPHPLNTRLSIPQLFTTKASASVSQAQKRGKSAFPIALLAIVTEGKDWLEQPQPLLLLAPPRHSLSQRNGTFKTKVLKLDRLRTEMFRQFTGQHLLR
jgi:hypothetical protein